MPAFNASQTPPYTTIDKGATVPLFNAETVAANEISMVICRGGAPSDAVNITFQGHFASAPTASVQLFGSNFTPTTTPQHGISVGPAQTTQDWQYTDNIGFLFYWAVVGSYSAGGAFTLLAQR